jgi:hypothetical protein
MAREILSKRNFLDFEFLKTNSIKILKDTFITPAVQILEKN